MRRHTKIAAILILGVFIALLARSRFHRPEPHYQGKPLSYWVLLNARPVRDDQFNPRVAIAAMGTNAVPCLVEWMNQKPYRWQVALRTFRNKGSMLRRWIPFWTTGINTENRAMSALAAMECLGPAGSSAIPQLEVLANNSNYFSAQHATSALCKIGAEAMPALLTVATNRQAKARLMVIDYLGESGSTTAVATLRHCLHDPSPFISSAAARALGKLKEETIVVVPTLEQALDRAP